MLRQALQRHSRRALRLRHLQGSGEHAPGSLIRSMGRGPLLSSANMTDEPLVRGASISDSGGGSGVPRMDERQQCQSTAGQPPAPGWCTQTASRNSLANTWEASGLTREDPAKLGTYSVELPGAGGSSAEQHQNNEMSSELRPWHRSLLQAQALSCGKNTHSGADAHEGVLRGGSAAPLRPREGFQVLQERPWRLSPLPISTRFPSTEGNLSEGADMMKGLGRVQLGCLDAPCFHGNDAGAGIKFGASKGPGAETGFGFGLAPSSQEDCSVRGTCNSPAAEAAPSPKPWASSPHHLPPLPWSAPPSGAASSAVHRRSTSQGLHSSGSSGLGRVSAVQETECLDAQQLAFLPSSQPVFQSPRQPVVQSPRQRNSHAGALPSAGSSMLSQQAVCRGQHLRETQSPGQAEDHANSASWAAASWISQLPSTWGALDMVPALAFWPPGALQGNAGSTMEDGRLAPSQGSDEGKSWASLHGQLQGTARGTMESGSPEASQGRSMQPQGSDGQKSWGSLAAASTGEEGGAGKACGSCSGPSEHTGRTWESGMCLREGKSAGMMAPGCEPRVAEPRSSGTILHQTGFGTRDNFVLSDCMVIDCCSGESAPDLPQRTALPARAVGKAPQVPCHDHWCHGVLREPSPANIAPEHHTRFAAHCTDGDMAASELLQATALSAPGELQRPLHEYGSPRPIVLSTFSARASEEALSSAKPCAQEHAAQRSVLTGKSAQETRPKKALSENLIQAACAGSPHGHRRSGARLGLKVQTVDSLDRPIFYTSERQLRAPNQVGEEAPQAEVSNDSSWYSRGVGTHRPAMPRRRRSRRHSLDCFEALCTNQAQASRGASRNPQSSEEFPTDSANCAAARVPAHQRSFSDSAAAIPKGILKKGISTPSQYHQKSVHFSRTVMVFEMDAN